MDDTSDRKEKSNNPPESFAVGDAVQWRWYGSIIEGRVVEIHRERVTRTIKGSRIVRNGSDYNPAYLVKSEAGNLALKLGTELTKRKRSFAFSG